MSHGAALRTTLDLVTPTLRLAAARLWSAPLLAERYPVYLRAMHGVVRASVPLMRAAVSRCTEPAFDRAVAEPLRAYLEAHIVQELHHDDWLLDDLSVIGASHGAPPGPVIARLAGAQYYWLHHVDPVCLLGYIAVLEGNAPSAHLADYLRVVTGLPDAAFRTLRHHADVDVAHSEELAALLDRLPLTARQRSAVTVSALSTVGDLVLLYDAIATGKPDAYQMQTAAK